MGQIGAQLGMPVGCYGDGERRLMPITVTTFESAYRHMPELGDRFDLLIIDEVHHFGAGTREDALVMSVARRRLGLTATPPRQPPATQRLNPAGALRKYRKRRRRRDYPAGVARRSAGSMP